MSKSLTFLLSIVSAIISAWLSKQAVPPGEEWVTTGMSSGMLESLSAVAGFLLPVVLKLFTIVRPTHAYFGQKDAQQVEVVRRLIRDLALEIDLRVVPTVRDADGLALSSRNVLLSTDERERALGLHRALATGDPRAARELLESTNGLVVEYVEVADFDPPVLAGAVRVGSTRLIDNVPLPQEGEAE